MSDIVTTISGKEKPKKECRKMSGEYYHKGDVKIEGSGDCYYINGKYYKYNTGYIIYNHRTKQYEIKSKVLNLIKNGIVGFDKLELPIFGAFSLDEKEDPVELYYGGIKYYVLHEDSINPRFYLESLRDGVYYSRNLIRAVDFVFPTNCNQDIKRTLPYDSRDILDNYKEDYDRLYKPEYCKVLKSYEDQKTDLTHGLSFGLEFESNKGHIPKRITKKLGLIPLRDGSISGLEFVTIPLEGNKGMQTVLDCLDELEKRTTYDNDCSLHLHIGNLPRTEEFFIAAYKILFVLQDSIFDLFPFHKKHNYGVKRKAYTKPLPVATMLEMDRKINKKNMVENFDHVFKFLSLFQSFKEWDCNLENVIAHPSDPGNHAKWNIKSRYYWVNLIPLLFGNKQTIEFRIHTPTYDKNKTMYFMMLCFAIVSYIKKNQKNIIKDFNNFTNLSINDVLIDAYYTNSNNYNIYTDLQRYFDRRKNHFYHKTAQGDFVANEDEFNTSYLLNFNKKKDDENTKRVKFSSNVVKNYGYNDIRPAVGRNPVVAEPQVNWFVNNDLAIDPGNPGLAPEGREQIINELEEILENRDVEQ